MNLRRTWIRLDWQSHGHAACHPYCSHYGLRYFAFKIWSEFSLDFTKFAADVETNCELEIWTNSHKKRNFCSFVIKARTAPVLTSFWKIWKRHFFQDIQISFQWATIEKENTEKWKSLADYDAFINFGWLLLHTGFTGIKVMLEFF